MQNFNFYFVVKINDKNTYYKRDKEKLKEYARKLCYSKNDEGNSKEYYGK